MANVTRCDNCKKLSDDDGVGYVGTEWVINRYKEIWGTIRLKKDLCASCLRNAVRDLSISKDDKDDY